MNIKRGGVNPHCKQRQRLASDINRSCKPDFELIADVTLAIKD